MPDPSDEAIDIYDQVAERFDVHIKSSAHNAYYERPATLALLPDVKGKRVLDAGCGSGAYSEWLVKQGAFVVAVDASPRMVALTKEKLAPRVEVYQHDLRKSLDFLEANSFDLVICPLVLDHIENLECTFSEFRRLLKCNGLFIFSMSHPFNDFAKKGTNYFDIESIRTVFPNLATEMPSYRRPLRDICNALHEARFNIDRLVEPLPIDECKQIHPEAYEKLSTRPIFICIRARRTE